MSLKQAIAPFAEPARQIMTAVGVAMIVTGNYSAEDTTALLGGAIAFGSLFWLTYDKVTEAIEKAKVEKEEPEN